MFLDEDFLILGLKPPQPKKRKSKDDTEPESRVLWQDEVFKSLKIKKYTADLEEQQLRMDLIRQQILESKRRQEFLELKVEILRKKKTLDFDNHFGDYLSD